MFKTLKTLAILALIPFSVLAQEFVYEPSEPKAGEEITITFTPSALMPVRFTAYQMQDLRPQEIPLNTARSRGVYTLTLTPDADADFVYFVVTMNKVPDSNNGEGYYIELFENGKPKKGANLAKTYFYLYYGEESGVESDTERAFAAIEKEIKTHPDNREAKTTYFRLLLPTDAEKAAQELINEIELTKTTGLKTEGDYQYLATLYNLTKNKEEADRINEEKKEKFPEGEWLASQTINEYYDEKDLAKKKEMLAEIEKNMATKPNWEKSKSALKSLQGYLLRDYIEAGDWYTYENAIKTYDYTIESAKNENELIFVMSNYNTAALKMQEKEERLDLAVKLMEGVIKKSKGNWDLAIAERKSERTRNSAKNRYAMYLDTYAMVLLANNQTEEAFKAAEEAALTITEGKNEEYNTTYAKVAEKTLSETEFKEALETFVKDGKSTSYIKEVLQKTYISEKGSSEGFQEYLAELEVESKKKLREGLLAKLQNKPAPGFSLVNLEGETVSLEELKGKTVIIDFWATWCGPCIASFPAMQEAQEKYQDNPDVKFVFINSWEQGEDKETKVAEFIKNGKYPFDVLFDKGDKVIGSYGVSGIPTKFIVDGKGNIRFTSIGFGGGKDKAVDELSMMIEIAGEE